MRWVGPDFMPVTGNVCNMVVYAVEFLFQPSIVQVLMLESGKPGKLSEGVSGKGKKKSVALSQQPPEKVVTIH